MTDREHFAIRCILAFGQACESGELGAEDVANWERFKAALIDVRHLLDET